VIFVAIASYENQGFQVLGGVLSISTVFEERRFICMQGGRMVKSELSEAQATPSFT
jgi:hypothetical protein